MAGRCDVSGRHAAGISSILLRRAAGGRWTAAAKIGRGCEEARPHEEGNTQLSSLDSVVGNPGGVELNPHGSDLPSRIK